MSIVTVNTPFNIDLEFQTATFGRRVYAWVLDLVILCAYNYVIQFFVLSPLGYDSKGSVIVFFVFTAIPCFLYNLLFEVFFNGQSPGKRLAKIKVISREGDEATLSQYLTRWLLGLGNYIMFILPYLVEYTLVMPLYIIYLLIIATFFYLPDIICIAVSAKSQRLGDIAAGTVVIDERSKTNIDDTIYLEIDDKDYKAKFPQVMRLTDRDINGIRNLLDAKHTDKDAAIYTAQIANRIKEVLVIDTDLEPRELLHQLLQDYNYLTHK